MFTTQEAAKMAGVEPRNWLYHVRLTKVPPARVVGRSSLWGRDAVDAVKARRKSAARRAK